MRKSNCDLEREHGGKFMISDLTRWSGTARRSVCVCVGRDRVPSFTFDLPRLSTAVLRQHTHTPKSFPLDLLQVMGHNSGVDMTLEMPFVSGLPMREKSKLAQVWDEFREMKAIIEERGPALPIGSAAVLLGVSVQRVHQLVNDGRFNPVEIHGRAFICEDDIEAYARSERSNGRPVSLPGTVHECFTRALAGGKAVKKVEKNS